MEANGEGGGMSEGGAGGQEATVLVGTRKGLFVARSQGGRSRWSLEGPRMAGYEIQSAFVDPRRPGTCYAAAHHPVWGIHIHRSRDLGHSWQPLREVPSHGGVDDDPSSLRVIWCVAPGADAEPDTLYAAIEPPGLFVSRDAGETWQPLEGFNRHPTRDRWHPAKGGMAVHSVQVQADDPRRVWLALSAGGVYRSEDGGESFRPLNRGVRAPYLADAAAEAGHCVHRIALHPADPSRLYQQGHHGTYRSDDGGESWTEITDGLPSDFGYALALDPADPDRLFVVPEESSQFRATVDGRLRVYRTDDAGASWQALTEGLPQENVFVTILRDGLAADGLQPNGLYLGTSSGHLFHSPDAGEHWSLVAGFLPGILCLSAAASPEPAE